MNTPLLERALAHIAAFEAAQPRTVRRAGAIYTPPRLARALAHIALEPLLQHAPQPEELRRLRILDPACGAGALLLAALDLLAHAHHARSHPTPPTHEHDLVEHRRAVLPTLCGLDLDPRALDACHHALAIACAHEPHRPATPGPALASCDTLLEPLPERFPSLFDSMLGNPPFGSVNQLGRHAPRQLALRERFRSIWQDKLDLAAFFVARGCELAPRAAWLLPGAILASDKGRRFRAWLLEHHHVRLLDPAERPLFGPYVAVTAAVLAVAPPGPPSSSEGWRLPAPAPLPVPDTILWHTLDAFARHDAPPDGVVHAPLERSEPRWHIAPPTDRARWRAMDAHAAERLGERYRVGKGMETGCNRAFELDQTAVEHLQQAGVEPHRWLRPRIRGAGIRALSLAAPTRWLLWVEDADDFDALPAPIRDHLLRHRAALQARAAYQRGNCAWWRYTWPLHRERVATAYRAISPYRAREATFAPVAPGAGLGLTDTTAVFVHSAEEARALCAYLMSAPLQRRFAGLTKRTGAGMMEFFENQLREVPLPQDWPALVAALVAALEQAPWPAACDAVDALVEAAFAP